MPSISLFQKLLEQLGEKGLLQAAKAEGVVAKSAKEVPDTVLQKILAKSGKMERPEVIEKLPTKAELDAIEKSNAGSDVAPEFRETSADTFQPSSQKLPAPEPTAPQPEEGIGSFDTMLKSPAAKPTAQAPLESGQGFSVGPSDPASAGMAKMLRGMGAATAVGAAGLTGYKGVTGSWGEPEKVEVSPDAGASIEKSLKERVQAAKAAEAVSPGTSPKGPLPSIPVPKVGARPEDYSAGKFEMNDADYQKKLSGLQNQEEVAKGEYKKNKNINAWGDVAERVSQAAAQFGAAQQGLKSGVDLSGLKFGRADWAGKTEQEGKDLEREQRSLGNQRDTAKESFHMQTGAAERQFGREESAKEKATGQKFREHEAQIAAANAAKTKNAELQIAQAKDAAAKAERAAEKEFDRTNSLEDFEKRQQILKAGETKESPEEKASKKREESISGLHSAYLSKDEKEIAKQRLAATKYLTPEQANQLAEAEDSWFGSEKKAAKVLEDILTGAAAGNPAVQGTDPSVIIRKDPKSGRNVKYDAKTKKPLGWAE